jgi:triphosphatase
VHRGRIALRRLRAALQLFEPVVVVEAFQRLDDELKRLAHVFGEARDPDVFQQGTVLPAAEKAAIPGVRDLANHMEAKRDAAHDAVNMAINSGRVRFLLVDLVDWIEDGAWRRSGSKEAQKPIEAFARPALRKRRERLVKQGADLANLDARSRHRIRIKAKKLRYMVDFFKDAPKVAAKPKAMKMLLVRLEELQARLGKVHDEDAKAAFVEQAVRDLPSCVSHMPAFAAGVLAAPRDLSGELSAAVDAFPRLEKTKPF